MNKLVASCITATVALIIATGSAAASAASRADNSKVTSGRQAAATDAVPCSTTDAQSGAKNKVNDNMPNRISMNVTTPRQTQGATFGEKVNAGLHAAGGAVASGAAATENAHRPSDCADMPNGTDGNPE